MEETTTLPVLRSNQLRTGDRAGVSDPLRELTALQHRMSQLTTSMLGPVVNADLLAGTSNLWTPLADVTETDDAYLVEIDVPASTART
jgi:HSP20 family protein